MVNMLQISSSKTSVGKTRWYSIYLCWHWLIKNIIWETLKRKNSNKEKSTMYHMSQYHPPKTPSGKMDDMTVFCRYCLIKNFIWETQREKYKEKSRIWCFQQVINQRDERLSRWNLQTFRTSIQHIWNVEYNRPCEYLFEIITST